MKAGRKRRPGSEPFDWHADPITPRTKITATYRNTQNVRRFFRK
jgi:hypothetical protein